MDCTQARERLQKQSSDARTKKEMELGRLGFNGGEHEGLVWMCVRREGEWERRGDYESRESPENHY